MQSSRTFNNSQGVIENNFTQASSSENNAYFPTIQECAVFALDAYNLDHNNLKASPLEGWYVSSLYAYKGFFVKCYVKGSSLSFEHPMQPEAVVFAYRGTVLTDTHNLASDVRVFFENFDVEDFYYNQVQFFVKELTRILTWVVGEKWYDKLKKIPIVNVGHSLGGIYSDLMNAVYHEGYAQYLYPAYTDYNNKSITFENPGSKNIIKYFHGLFKISSNATLEINPNKYTTYNADVNFINCCNEQAGKAYRLIDLPYDYNLSLGVRRNTLSEVALNNPYYFAYSIQQHGIANITSYLLNGGKVIEYTYPVGLQNSYIAYLNGDVRSNYWKGFFKALWDVADDITKIMYKDFNSFYEYKMEELEKIHDKAILHGNKLATTLTPVYIIPAAENKFRDAIKNESILPATQELAPVYIPSKPVGLITQHSMFSTRKEEKLSSVELLDEDLQDFVFIENTKKAKRKCTIL